MNPDLEVPAQWPGDAVNGHVRVVRENGGRAVRDQMNRVAAGRVPREFQVGAVHPAERGEVAGDED